MDKVTLYSIRLMYTNCRQLTKLARAASNQKLELWRYTLQSKSFRIKVRLNMCTASLATYKSEAEMRLVRIAVIKCKQFGNLGSIFHEMYDG